MSFYKASRWIGCLALALSLGCDRKEPAPTRDEPAVTPQPVPKAAPKPVALIADNDVRALLTRWLEAQNNGDFESYASLYATRVYGEKRAADRVYKLDRTGWLRDRKRMFARPMKLAAANVNIKIGPATAVLTFEQSFSQASFQDRGPKRMTLVRENGSLRISTEMMLASTVTTDSPAAAQDFFFVVHVNERAYVVLSNNAQRAWGVGAPLAPYISKSDHTYVVLQKTAGLPAEQTAQAKRPLRIYNREGASCDTTPGEVMLMAAVTPHFSTVQALNGTLDPEHPEPPRPAAEVSATILSDIADEELALVAELTGCDGVFATSPERKVSVLPKTQLEPPIAGVAAKELARTSIWKRIQSDWQADLKEFGEPPATTKWPETTELAAFGTNGQIISAFAARGTGCALFTGHLSALLSVNKGKVSLLAAGRPSHTSDPPYLVIDLDGDNVLEILTRQGDFAEHALNRITGTTLTVLKRVPYSFQDCGC